jgi:outer membrane receptor protein involved in Fe transport
VAQEPGEVKKLEPVVVTGSSLPTADLVGATPVDVVTDVDIAKIGSQSVLQYLKTIPSTIGAGNYGESRGNGGDGSAAVSIRGISGGTLVLINGRRVAPNWLNIGTGNVDINAIPLGAIDRVEILKDGASAIYGSDAQAGVVNIILKKDYTGTEMYGSYGNTTDTDVGQQHYYFVTGLTGEKSSLLVGASYYKANALFSQDRSRSRVDITDPLNTSPTSNPGRIGQGTLGTDGIGVVYDGPPGTFSLDPDDFRDFNPLTDRFPFPLYTPSIRPSERWSIFSTSSHDLMGKHLTFFTEAFYTRSLSMNQLAPTPITSGSTGLVIPSTNPYNPFGIDIDTWRYRTLELGPRVEDNTADIFRFVGGFRGRIADTSWEWETAVMYSEDDRRQVQSGDVSLSGLEAAINRTDETAFNPFGNQANNADQLFGVGQTISQSAKSTLFEVGALARGEVFQLPAGPLQLALGGSHLEAFASFEPDALTIAGETVGFNAALPFTGRREVDAVFAEVGIPLTSEKQALPVLHSLELKAAVRYDDYSDFGDTTNPKITARWQPIDETLTLRGAWGTSFVAPTFDALYSESQSFPEVANPFTGSFDQVDASYFGTPDLKPEEGSSYTLGMVWTPKFAKGLTFAIDYYNLNIKNRVGGSAQYIIDTNFRTGVAATGLDPTDIANAPAIVAAGEFASLLTWDPAQETYTKVNVPFLNLSEVQTDGLDIQTTYEIPTDNLGTFTLSGSGTYVLTFKQKETPGSAFRDRLGDFSTDDFGFGSIPRWKANVGLFWAFKQIEFGVTAYYVGAYRDDPLAGVDREISDIWTVDLQASYNFPYQTKLTIGVINVADEPPPLAEAAFADKYDRDLHDIRQRFVYFSILKKF